MKRTTAASLLITMLLSCSFACKHSNENQWKLAQIGFPYGENTLNDNDKIILSELKQMTLTINDDYLYINDKYKTKIVKKTSSTNNYFGDSETLKSYFIREFDNKKVNITDSISYWELEGESSYPDFSFENYSLWGTIIGNEDYICLVYNQVFVLWFKNSSNEYSENQLCITPSKFTLPYNERLDYKNISYESIPEATLKQPDNPEQSCYSENGKIRYISLPNKNNISIIIVPHDGGDFPYRYYLYTIIGDKLIDSIYAEGEWSEPGSDETVTTSFSIDTEYKITITTNSKDFTDIKNYRINDIGKFYEVGTGLKEHRQDEIKH